MEKLLPGTDAEWDERRLIVQRVPENQEPDPLRQGPWAEVIYRSLSLTAVVPLLLGIWTMMLRAKINYDIWAAGSMPQHQLLAACLLLVIGLSSFCTSAILDIPMLLLSLTGRYRPRLRLLGDNVPPIDVIITACNEALDLIQDTVRAALNVDYPADRLRVLISDDGQSAKLEAWAAATKERFPNLHYTARRKTGPAGYKAGNLNHALAVLASLPGRPAPFVAGLDADMIPSRRWLRHTVAHLVKQADMGLACPTQLFYNTPPTDPLGQDRLAHWRSVHILQDMAGVSWNHGSGWVARRAALDDIGGFPTATLLEDVHSSVEMAANGWRVAYVYESLQYGLVPETMGANLKQWTRWYIGGCQLSLHFKFFLSRSATRKLTYAYRILHIACGWQQHVNTHVQTLGMVLRPLVLATGWHLLLWRTHDDLRLLVRLSCVTVLAGWLMKCQLALITGYQVALKGEGWMGPYYTIAYFRSFVLPASWGGKLTTFTPTNSLRNPIHERDQVHRAALRDRLRYFFFDNGIWMHATVAGMIIAGVAICVHRTASAHLYDPITGERTINAFWIQLLHAVAWPGADWATSLLECTVPIWYAFWPPSMPARADLMGRRDENGGRYPMEKYTSRFVPRTDWKYMVGYHFYLLGVFGVFVSSWWI